MTLPTKYEYADRYDGAIQELTADLNSLHLPSLAGRIASRHHEVTVDYHRDRKIPLWLSTETGQVCTRHRHQFVQNWIDKVDGALLPGCIEILEAVGRPDNAARATVSALHLRALAARLWVHGPVYELLQRFPLRIRLEVTNEGESAGFSLPPDSQSGASTHVDAQPVDSTDLLEAAKLVGEHWTEFCSHARPWLAAGGISRLVISCGVGS